MTNRLDNLTAEERNEINEINFNPKHTNMKITPNYLKSLELGDATLSINRSSILFNQAAIKLLALDEKSGFTIIKPEEVTIHTPVLEYQDEVPGTPGDCFTITGKFAKGGCQASAKGLFKLLFDTDPGKKKVYIIGELKNGKRALKLVRK
jgi:hypothetical protein